MKQLSALGNRRHYYRNATRITMDSQNSNISNMQQNSQNLAITDLMNTNSNSTQLISSRGNRFDMINENSEVIGQNSGMNFMNTGKDHISQI
jgi:hypothetical protein